MKDTVFPVCAGAAFGMLLYRARDLWTNRRDPALVALCVLFSLIGMLFTLSTSSVSAGIDRVVRVPNLAAFLIHVSIVLSSVAMHAVTLFWSDPPAIAWPRVRRRLLVLVPVLAVMATLFSLAGIKERTPHFLIDHVDNPVVAAYAVFFMLVLATGLVVVAHGCWRYGSAAGDPWLRRGLRTTGIGAAVGLGYCGTRLAGVIGVRQGMDPGRWEVLVPICGGAGTLLALAGLVMPTAGPALTDVRRRITQYRVYHKLYPLWAALYAAVPTIALDPPRSALGIHLPLGDIDFLVFRRIIEIHDGCLALRPWTGAGRVADAERLADLAGLSGAEREAAVEAHVLRSALNAKASGAPPAGSPDPTRFGRDLGDLSAEAAWFQRVSQAFGRIGTGRRGRRSGASREDKRPQSGGGTAPSTVTEAVRGPRRSRRDP